MEQNNSPADAPEAPPYNNGYNGYNGYNGPPPPPPPHALPPIPIQATQVQHQSFVAYNTGFNDGYVRGYYVAVNNQASGRGRGGRGRGGRGMGGRGMGGRGGLGMRGRGRGSHTTSTGQQVVFTAQATNMPSTGGAE